MRKRVSPVVAVALSFVLGAACGDDEVTAPNNFPQVVDCAQDCFDGYEAILEGLVHVLKKVDEPEMYELPAGITIDLVTGEFGFDLDLDDSAGIDSELEGVVEAGLASDCSDGMQPDEECDFDWVVTLSLEGDTTAAGINRATDLGLTPPPEETAAMRFRLGPDETALVVSENCGFIISSFSMILQLWDPTTPLTSVSMTFDTFRDSETMRGYIDWTEGAASEASLLLEYQGREYDCTFNIETFAIDCPE
jgi:hypothetical protein